MTKRLNLLISAILFLMLITACKREPVKGDVLLQISYKVDSQAAGLNSLDFTNPAGNQFSLTRLQYYISGIALTHTDGSIHEDDGAYYLDIEKPETAEILIRDVPVGEYEKVELTIGVTDYLNESGALPATTENNDMEWPSTMGGGYHHMKLEGYYIDNVGDTFGYALHLGQNGFQPVNMIQGISLTVGGNIENPFQLYYDIMEWHQNPEEWDFDTDGVSIMADTAAQRKLSNNGKDILSE